MKQLITIVSMALATTFVSAQDINVVTTYESNDTMSISNFTNNVGVLYSINDDYSVGVKMNGDNYDLIARYNYGKNIYVSLQAPTEEMMDNLNLGLGYSLSVWKGLSVEPNYRMVKEAEPLI